MFIYLAGVMSYYDKINKFELATLWRQHVSCQMQEYNIFDPCRNYDTNKTYNSKGVVYQNINFLNKADIIIVDTYDIDKSPGTLFEIYYAFLHHKPVIAFGDNVLCDQPHINASITIKFDAIDDVVKYIKNMYAV